MRAVIVSDCATYAYFYGLSALRPKWEIRGATIDIAEKWSTENPPKAGFVQLLQNCEIYIGLPYESLPFAKWISPQARKVLIPNFYFRGLQPDCFHLDGFDSVLGAGNLYSRIVAAAFQIGLSAEQTAKLFNPETYEALDYFGCFAGERENLISRFRNYNIDLSDGIERWLARGSFLHSYNHPRVDVLMEVFKRALSTSDILPVAEVEGADLSKIPDALGTMMLWPIYPEIASRHGLPGSLTWRRGQSSNFETLDLDRFIAASFQKLAERPLPDIADLPVWIDRIKPLVAA